MTGKYRCKRSNHIWITSRKFPTSRMSFAPHSRSLWRPRKNCCEGASTMAHHVSDDDDRAEAAILKWLYDTHIMKSKAERNVADLERVLAELDRILPSARRQIQTMDEFITRLQDVLKEM